MDSFPHSLYSVLFLTLALILLSVLPAFCSSIQILDDHQEQLRKIGFKTNLKHVDSGKNLTKLERLQRAMERERHRLQKFSEIILKAKGPKIKSKDVYPADGEFLVKLSIGTPRNTYSAIMDTGSDLIWTQCKPCRRKCFHQLTPVYDPKKSSSFSKMPCSSNLCRALDTSLCNDGCVYYYSYGDSSFTLGILASETFTFDKVSMRKIGFGCGEDNGGDFNTAAGIVGLGRGPLSLVSQLDEPKFSYRLPSMDGTKTGTLFMGSLAGEEYCSKGCGDIKTTPLIQNSRIPTFYYLSLEGISVGSIMLPINESALALNADGSGGLIIDSGTTITYLEESAYALVLKEFISQVKLPVEESVPTSIGLDLCFKLPHRGSISSVHIPELVFHFKGADLDLPRENYILTYSSEGLMCLAMGSSASTGTSIFGNVMQQNMQVVYDLHKETLSFVST